MTPRDSLILTAQRTGLGRDGAAPANELVRAAVVAMRADLPPAGPDPVEVEVAEMFEAGDREAVPAFDSGGRAARMINGREVRRGRAVARGKRRTK